MNFEDKIQEAFKEGYRQAINEQKKPLGPRRPGALLKRLIIPESISLHMSKKN